jgi:hypothetical protein
MEEGLMTNNNALYAVLRTHHRAVLHQEKLREQASYECFPIGTRAFWNHGKGLARVTVTRHGYGGSLVIRNIDTGKERRVDGWDERLSL